MPQQTADELPLPGATRTSLARIALRLRERGVTLAGWRLELQSPRGAGGITLAEHHYRGDGACLGMPQEALKQLYEALLPQDEPPEPGPQQLG